MGNQPDGFRVELNRDPLMNFVANRLGIETIYCAFFFHLLVVLYVWLTGNLFELSVPPHIEATVDISQLQLVTPLKDPIFITGIIFIVITGYVWLKLSSELPEALEDLERNGIVKEKKIVEEEDENTIVVFRRPFKFLNSFYTNKIAIPRVKEQKDVDEFDIFLKRFDYTLNNTLCYVAGVVGVLIYLYILYQYTMKTPVEESLILIWLNYRFFPVYFVIYQAIWIVGYFILTVIVWKMLQIAVYIRGLFSEFETDIRPFHPDKCGGLKPITQIVVNINLFVFASGLSLVIVYYTYLRTLIPNIWVLFAGYIFISLFLFFYPLLGARDSMRINKERFLAFFSTPLNREYELIFQEFRDGIDSYDKHLDEKHLVKVKTMRDFYDQAMKMPVWPFDRDTILMFASRVLLPLLLIVANMILAKYF